MKKSLCIILVFVLCFSLAGCITSDDGPTVIVTGKVVEQTPTNTLPATEPETTAEATETTTEVMTEPAAEEETAEPTAEEETAEPTAETTAETTEEPTEETTQETTGEPTVDNGRDYILNTNTKKFHYPNCKSAAKIKESNRKEYHGTREELMAMGYDPCGNCHP